MLPPPSSRQSSYVYSLPRNSKTGNHARVPSFRSAAGSVLGLGEGDDEDGPDEEEDDLDERRGEVEMGTTRGSSGRERGLEETLERLGFGAYHWRLLALCGFGWMSDNSALQCIAVILPRVQVHFDLSSKVVGLLSASTMAGMMIGAVGWGVVSDLLGRALPFNSTLFLTAVFGIAASFSPSFGILCFWMFCLGSAVGGSMPTDGTLFLENLPHSKQYLLTLLSVFFSLGAVLSSVVSLLFLPGASCRAHEGCDIDSKQNDGWRRVLFVLGLFNLACAFARWFLFRLQESPRYLVSTGRQQEAVVALQHIADYNDRPIDIQHADVQVEPTSPVEASSSRKYLPSAEDEGEESPLPGLSNGERGDNSADIDTRYGGIGQGPPRTPRKYTIRTGSAFYAPSTPGILEQDEEDENRFEEAFAAQREERDRLLFDSETANTEGEGKHLKGEAGGIDSHDSASWRDKPLAWWESWREQINKLFVPKWRRTVILMWIIWGSMSFAYTMFNVWLPSVLESRASGEGDEAIKEALNDYVLYSIAGCPGSILGAWMVQTRLGRRKSLAICTMATSLSTFAFIAVDANWAVVISSMVISGAATAMYAVLYGMTPETFGTSIRGTACGTSAALSRFTGVMAPVTAGILLSFSPSLPVLTSAAIFCVTAGCSLALPFERMGGKRGGGGMMH
ncbi:hypothetical protein CI109_106372 [Kwoniella shandongensis]|uniref:Uncharacterized protein n=1 Tax=Kwoniella shandongensis TaxID=1734106 RepID=A0A5M6BS77_9TREE|nr:uncharacterized protein CI109_005921 [Kwoniella shandongensis]KAA5525758.1 hypothetical protein CI109_005921 [Kwoniella shandongensis]